MNIDEFRQTLAGESAPPDGLHDPLLALWWDAKGDWHRAHEVCQRGETSSHAWVHAYLHRKEGDEGNAGYWYARAGRKPPGDIPLEEEWASLVKTFLE